MKKRFLIAAGLAVAIATAALAQAISTGNEFATQTAGKSVVGTVQMFWNAALGYAQPVSSTTPLPVSAGTGTNLAPFAAYSKATIARPNNTTTYTANTGWNNATSAATGFFSLTTACRVNGGQVLIPRIDIWSSANPATKLTGVVWLFSAVPGTNVSDNATFTIAAADFANLTGSVQGFAFTLGNAQTNSGASNSGASLTGTTFQAQCASGTTTITGMVEVTNAYVPAANEVLTVGVATIGAN
ncbi:hypothetical protein IC762_17900 [Bradyrhizobium genosp. L]|uniref:hypothetical protein n=1 Tax=Bradyrhizobium genosp. L TaxID=83637 RepID=UPI0018A3149C|nr:hypothetical protein [Bradyrhizobium genosp. L]QPF81697.1 hypothetical protein IC762_17900 [Bradyrhizobium genosp. L]